MQPASDGNENGSGRQLRRWGPILGIVVVLLVVVGAVVLISGDGDESDEATEGESPAGDDAGAGPGAPAPTGAMPVTYGEAVEAGTVDDYDWGDRCDTETGRVAMPSVYAAPCVPVFDGDNGGATYPGVTEDTITIVRYDADQSGESLALISDIGIDETDEDQTQTSRDYFEIFTSMTETYGREIEVIHFKATGEGDDEVAARADAIEIAEQYEPFAVIGGPGLDRGAFAGELASRGISCHGCAVAMPDWMAQENAPYNWGNSASAEQFLTTLVAWLARAEGGRLNEDGTVEINGPAEYAGDPALHEQERKVGVVHFEQDPPIFGELSTGLVTEGTIVEPYLLDLATAPEKSIEIIAKMKDEGVTSIVFLGDPAMPIYLTGAATNLDYYPEWIFTGTVLTDTNLFARQYDQEQMANAFGVAHTGVPVPQELQTAWSIYKWYYGQDAEPPAPSQYGTLIVSPTRLSLGIHMAGPDLTPETFEQGLFRVPPMGGGPTRVQVSYGDWGHFAAPDYFGTDDSTSIWWDVDAVGLDEIGREGTGMWRYVDGGARFTSVDPPVPKPFVEEGTVTIYETLPPEDQVPDYPPPPGSPAAG